MEQMLRAFRMCHHVVAIGREPGHAIDGKWYDRTARAHEQSADRPMPERGAEPVERGVCGGLSDRGAHALHGGGEPRRAEGLEDVVDRAELERVHRMLHVRGGEDDV